MWVSKHTEDFPKSPFEDKPSINDETKKVVFQIEFKDLTLELCKLDDPHITFYRSTGIIEVETNKRNFIFSLNGILFMKYDPEECDIYYE